MKSLVLASTSFRRQELLSWLGIPFEIVSPDFDEYAVQRGDFQTPAEYMKAIAVGKALSVAENHDQVIILSGDTMVEFDGKMLGKPKDLNDAREMLTMLMGKTHRVLSAVCVYEPSARRMKCSVETSSVTFKPVSAKDIDDYVATSEPLGKAGSYAIQSGAKKFVDHVDGSVTNVLGLPLILVGELLKEFGYEVLTDIPAMIRHHLQDTES